MVLVLCRIAVFAALAWVVTAVPVASAGPLDTCAQRVIRDWFSGGRVNDVYPLPCYRAAIRELPDDVLEYSEADRDIARALAFARRGRAEPDRSKVPTRPESTVAPRVKPARSEPSVSPRAKVPVPAIERPVDTPARLASGPEPTDVSAAVPYPVIVLAALAGTLLVTGAVGWALARRR
jgi:hypothetical protein